MRHRLLFATCEYLRYHMSDVSCGMHILTVKSVQFIVVLLKTTAVSENVRQDPITSTRWRSQQLGISVTTLRWIFQLTA